MNRKQHVIPFGDKWAVRVEGNLKINYLSQTKKEAITNAVKIAHRKASDVIIHYRNGKVENTNGCRSANVTRR